MSVAVWSVIWQVIIAATCVAFFALSVYVSVGAIRDASDMFHELSEEKKE